MTITLNKKTLLVLTLVLSIGIPVVIKLVELLSILKALVG